MQYLRKWERPDNYAGSEWPEYYVFLGQHRDADTISRSNFQVALEQLGGESDTVFVVREGHWAVGWVEWIAIHEKDKKAFFKAVEINERLEHYPVLDDSHLSELEWNEAAEYWEGMSISERMEYCRRAHISIFSARHSYLPSDPYGSLMELLTRA